jgi:hypothetical protein
MSAYNPPTRDSVIFNPEYFQTSLADLDTTYLNQNYLKFPFAQGLQNMQKINITDTTESSDVNSGSLVTDGGIGLAKNLNVGGLTTATGLITANGGLTTGAGQVLTSTGNTVLTGNTIANSLIIANGGLTTAAGQVLTSTGNTVLTGNTTATGLILADGGLTMGGTNIITLGTGATAATSTQLGYTVNPSLTTLSTTIATGTLTKSYYSFTLPAGTWITTFKVVVIPSLNTATNAYLSVLLSPSVDTFTGGFGNQVFGLQPSAAFQTIILSTPYFNSTSKTIYLTISNVANNGNITFNASTQCSIIRIA